MNRYIRPVLHAYSTHRVRRLHHVISESSRMGHRSQMEVGLLRSLWLRFAWVHEICTHDNERAIVIAAMNEMAYVLQAWLPLLVWQQVDAPEYRKGFVTISFLSAALIVTALAIRVLRARAVAGRGIQEDGDRSSDGSSSDGATEIVLGGQGGDGKIRVV
jgi:hypothetical protein